jgi:L-alanine-DL-glutamate epimerase-like enolase superfamily enzyme
VCLAASLTAFPVDRYACDLMGSLFYAESATTPPVKFDRGQVALPQGPGFGVVPRV